MLDGTNDRPDMVDGTNAYAWRPVPLWPGIEDPMEDWGGLEIPTRLKEALTERGILQPSPIQSMAMPKMSEGENMIIHAPTGGGKTLAFLIPMLARLQPTLHVGLQALILVPTPELALQITRELRWLFEALCGQERACWFNPQVPRELGCEVLLSRRALWDAMRQDTAVIVTTPSILLAELIALQWQAKKFTETLAYFMCGNLSCIIMDEVDAMCKPGSPSRNPKYIKQGAAERVLEFLFDVVRNRYRNRPVQLVSASATANSHKVSKTLNRILEKKWKKRRDAARRRPPILIQHGARVDELQIGAQAGESWVQVPKSITHYLATTSSEKDDRFGKERLTMVAKIVKSLEGTILVFVPEKIKLDAMVVVLREAGVHDANKYRSVIGLGQDVEQLADPRLDNTRMVKEKGQNPVSQAGSPSEFALRRGQELADDLAKGQSRVLIAKADTVRGMDIENVSHVVLYEFPGMAMDYLHLAGRTGRMGRSGNVISVVTPMEKRLLHDVVQLRLGISFCDWEIEEANMPRILPRWTQKSRSPRSSPRKEGGTSSAAPAEQGEAPAAQAQEAPGTSTAPGAPSAVEEKTDVATPGSESLESVALSGTGRR